MKFIIETKNKGNFTFLIDQEDYDLIENKKVNLHSSGYARVGRKKLHRLIMERLDPNIMGSNLCVDHINHDRLDNTRANLRIVTVRGNNMNKILTERKFQGSTYLKRINRWQSQVKINGKMKYLGCHKTEEEAYNYYMLKCKEMGLI